MKRHNFDYFPVAYSEDDGWEGITVSLGGDVVRARSHGYGAFLARNLDTDPAAPKTPNATYRNQLSTSRQNEYFATLNGSDPMEILVEVPDRGTMQTNSDGCNAAAQEELYGSHKIWVRVEAFFQSYDAVSSDLAVRDIGFVSALSDWRACMQGKGYLFKNPGEAYTAAVELYTSTTGAIASPKPAEVAIAVADAECDSRVHLTTTRNTLTERYGDRWLNRHSTEILTYRHMRMRAIEKAKMIAQKSATPTS